MSRSESPEVVVIGASCMDVKARPLSPLTPGISAPASIRMSLGVSARNMAENLGRLGVRTTLLSVVGTDILGHRLMERTGRAGVDVSHVLRCPSCTTGSYLALFTDGCHKGYVLDDVSQLKEITPEYIGEHSGLFKRARMLMMDGNLDTEAMAAVLSICRDHGIPVGIDPVSARRAFAIRPLLSEFSLVTPNAAEAEALTDIPVRDPDSALQAARKMVSTGVGLAVVTMAEEGLVYVTSEGLGQGYGRIPAVTCEVVDWTGAGDALAAAVAYGMLNQMPADDCMWLGVAAAAATLQSPESVNPKMNLDLLYANLAL